MAVCTPSRLYDARVEGSLGLYGALTANDCAVDYILFAVADVELAPDVEEVREVKYVSADELKTMLADERTMFTPWFKLAAATMLFQWWGEWEESLASGWSEGRVESSVLQSEILRMC